RFCVRRWRRPREVGRRIHAGASELSWNCAARFKRSRGELNRHCWPPACLVGRLLVLRGCCRDRERGEEDKYYKKNLHSSFPQREGMNRECYSWAASGVRECEQQNTACGATSSLDRFAMIVDARQGPARNL